MVVSLQVPKGFSYFSVDFGMQGGYAHVIEDERSFPAYFGRVRTFDISDFARHSCGCRTRLEGEI